MEVRNCKQCGKLYNYIGGAYRMLCPVCTQQAEEKFRDVKKYIQEHPHADIREVAQENDIAVKQIEKWVREERLSFTDDSDIGIACERCGKMIKTGRFCAECANQLGNTLTDLYRQEVRIEKKKHTGKDSKMRYLEH